MQFKTSLLGAALVLGAMLPAMAQNGATPPMNNPTMPMSGTPSPTLRELVQQRTMEMNNTPVPGPMPMGGSMTPMGGAMAPMGGSMPMGGAMAPTITMQSSMAAMMALPAMDQLFMTRAAEGNLAEITLSQLALQKTKNPNVKMVAQTIVDEHTKAHQELLAAARAKGIMLMPMLSAGHMAIQKNLEKAKKADFDKMYMAVQVEDHENTVALFHAEITAGGDADAKALAQKQLPGIVGHTIMIYNVARQVGAPGMDVRPMMPPVPPSVDPASIPTMPMDGGSMAPAPAM